MIWSTVDFDGNIHMFMTERKGKFFLCRLTGSEIKEECKYTLVL